MYGTLHTNTLIEIRFRGALGEDDPRRRAAFGTLDLVETAVIK
jgi:hypothetical protein